MHRGFWSALAGCALAAQIARAAPSDAPTSVVYPLTVALRLSPQTAASVFAYPGGDGLTSPAAPASDVPVGAQVREAYAAALRETFRVPVEGVAPDAELEVTIAAVDVAFQSGGWRAFVEHHAVLRAGDREIGRWTIRRDEPIARSDPDAVPRAFASAAQSAARRLTAKELEDSAAVKAWLAERRVDVAAIAELRDPPRPPWGTFVDLGGGFLSAGGGSGLHYAARAGFTAPAFLVQLAVGHWSAGYAAATQSTFSDPRTEATSIGVDAALRYPIGRWELRAGGGPHLLQGHIDQTYPIDTTIFPGDPVGRRSFAFSMIVPSAFAAVQYVSPPGPLSARVRFGLEARGYFGTSANFPEYGAPASIAQGCVNLFLGVELPVGPRGRPAGGRRP